MRILRGTSNLEVSSRGFALFVVGLVLATFFGGAVRTILSSDRVHQWIVKELRDQFPRNDVQIGRTEVLLARGIWPGLGLRVFDLSFAQEACGKLSFNVSVPSAVLPLDLWSLRRRHPRLGRVSLDGARLRLDYHDCIVSKSTPASSAERLRVTVTERGIHPPRLPWAEVSRVLAGLELSNVEITYARNVTWRIFLRTARVWLGEEMSLEAQADVQKTLPNTTLHHNVRLNATGVGDELRWHWTTAFKEGDIDLGGSWDLTKNTATARARLTQLPLKEFSSELFQMGFSEQDIKLRASWLTCAADWEGSVAAYAAVPLKVRACKLEGAYGRAELAGGEARFDRAETFRPPAKLRVENLQVQPLVEALGQKVLPVVFARLGVWSGAIDYAGPRDWLLDGELNAVEVNFSNLSTRGKQGVTQIHTFARHTAAGLNAMIDRANVVDGAFAGRIGLTLDPSQTGDFHAELTKFKFSPAIQKLLIGGQLSPLSGQVTARLRDGVIAEGTSDLTANEAAGPGWRAEALHANLKFQRRELRLELGALRAEADQRWSEFSKLRVTERADGDALAWRDVGARVLLSGDTGVLEQALATETSRPTVWRAKGHWVRDAQFAGTLMVGLGHQAQVFTLGGEKGTLSIERSSH